MQNKIKGNLGEAVAENFLKSKGYVFVERNYKCKGSEIDLIFIDPVKRQKKEIIQDINQGTIKKELKKSLFNLLQNVLVFVEVKFRTNNKFGEAFESVDVKKQQHIIRGAHAFLKENKLENNNIRFDIISIDGDNITHIKQAF